MPEIYCTKCGIQGSSKCPHCRSVFSDHPKNEQQRWAQDYFEMFMNVGLKNRDDKAKLEAGEQVRFQVSFWHYANNDEEAIASILGSLHDALPLANLTVASCIHDWQLMPGEASSIGCGCESAPAGTAIPDNPFA